MGPPHFWYPEMQVGNEHNLKRSYCQQRHTGSPQGHPQRRIDVVPMMGWYENKHRCVQWMCHSCGCVIAYILYVIGIRTLTLCTCAMGEAAHMADRSSGRTTAPPRFRPSSLPNTWEEVE